MNGSCETPPQQLCGCCQGVGTETPEPISNRPGLSAISYRVGTHATFKASLLAGLSDSDLPALAPLRTRDDADFSIALLDAWAVSLDILSFYQERIVNESYLRTAVDAASVTDLAQLVGYQPSPGVAASAFLAFTLSSTPGSPDNVLIPAGSRVQSVPGPGQTPQVFETSADLTAVIAQNAIPVETTVPWGLNASDTSLWLQGTSNNINVGDGILFVSQGLYALASGASTSGTIAADFHFVTAVTLNSTSGNTLVQWDQPLKWPTVNDNTAYVYVFRKKAALFGVQAPDPRTLLSASSGSSGSGNNLASLAGWPSGGNGDWTFQYKSGSLQINLDASYPGIAPAQGQPGWTLLVSPDFTALYQITAAVDTGPVLYTLTTKTTQLTLANGHILVNNVDTPAEIAQLESALTVAENTLASDFAQGLDPTQTILAMEKAATELELALGTPTGDQVLADIVSQTRSATAYVQSNLLTPADTPYLAADNWAYSQNPDQPIGPVRPLERLLTIVENEVLSALQLLFRQRYATQSGLLTPIEGSQLNLVGGEQLSTGQPVAVSGKRLRLQVSTSFSASGDSAAGFVPNGATGSLPLAPGQIFLIDAFPPTAAPTGTDQLWSVITTDGVAGTLQINSDNVVLIPADKNDPVAGESTTISTVNVLGPIVTLKFVQPLARIYDGSTVTVNANVVVATNGETMYEILGNGDGTNPALQFTLKQSPLTYVSSALGMGATSTLQVWVNNLQWHEVSNFLDSAPTDRVFTTTADATGKVTVQFGDGQEGERTPTGQMNIRAVYRKGIGADGNVPGGQLSQALDRPQGLRSVTNPDPATGGADPDSADDTRTTAPLHVLTLGRVVSLEDYQNYALAFAGIAKALATWTWTGRARSVFLTVAGANGLVFQSDDPTITHLITALQTYGNPYVPLQVVSYSPMLFEVGAQVAVDTNNYDPTQVLAQVWQALAADFSFAQRQIGQGVAPSEVIAVIQQTPGVIAVELTELNLSGQTASLQPVLRAASPTAGQQGTPQAAQMLLLDPASQGNLEVWSL
jgi:hypothetical protein